MQCLTRCSVLNFTVQAMESLASYWWSTNFLESHFGSCLQCTKSKITLWFCMTRRIGRYDNLKDLHVELPVTTKIIIFIKSSFTLHACPLNIHVDSSYFTTSIGLDDDKQHNKISYMISWICSNSWINFTLVQRMCEVCLKFTMSW